MTTVHTEEELAKAIERNEDSIEIEGDLAQKTIRIRAAGKVAWAIAFGAITVAVLATLSMIGTAGTDSVVAAPIALISATGAVGVLGATTTYSAVAIAVAAGGVAALTRLRNYKEVSRGLKRLVLQRK